MVEVTFDYSSTFSQNHIAGVDAGNRSCCGSYVPNMMFSRVTHYVNVFHPYFCWSRQSARLSCGTHLWYLQLTKYQIRIPNSHANISVWNINKIKLYTVKNHDEYFKLHSKYLYPETPRSILLLQLTTRFSIVNVHHKALIFIKKCNSCQNLFHALFSWRPSKSRCQ